MNVLIIEDEPRAARQLKQLLMNIIDDLAVLDVLDSIESTIQWFERNRDPDLVFMDIQLADGLSFEIFQAIEIDSPIIFTTAFDQYAIRAFKVNSVDYLLKPIQQNELIQAMNKFKKMATTVDTSLLTKMLHEMQSKNIRKGILVKEGTSWIQLKVSDLLYVYSESSITFGVTKDKRYIIEETLDNIQESLSIDDFFRINRGQLVSKNSILKITPYLNHRVKLTLHNPRNLEFVVSRQKTTEFKKWMNQ